MPAVMKKKSRPDPNAVYVCRETISFAVGVAVQAGERRRGDDPLVADHFAFWAPDGTPPESQIPTPPLRKEAVPDDIDAFTYEELHTLDVVISRRPLKVAHAAGGATTLPAGTVLDRGAELVRLLPDAFEAPPKVKR